MKILFLITGLGVGGAERQVVDLADRLVSLGNEIKIVYLTGPALMRPISSEIEIIGLGIRKKSIKNFFLGSVRLRYILKKFQPDIVHSHMVHANIFARVVRLFCHINFLICTAHNKFEGGALRMFGYRVTNALGDVFSNVSEEAVQEFEASHAARRGSMLCIRNGIEVGRFARDPTERLRVRESMGVRATDQVVLAVGRLNTAKDYPNLIRAVELLANSNENLRVWIIGDGEERPLLQAEVSRRGLSSRILFLGIRHNIAAWMSAADVFVLSSAWEGFGLVVAEAMACELVVVATDAGGVKEVLGGCGYLVPVRDASALACALRDALSLGEEQRRALGVSARSRVVDTFSMDAVVGRWLEIYSRAPVRS